MNQEDMVRSGKIQMRRIENAISRQVTFSKRRNGLLNKAHKLSIPCDAEVAVIIFSQKGKLFEFASANQMEKTIDRCQKKAKQVHRGRIDVEQYKKELGYESTNMAEKIELIEILQQKLMGQNLDSFSPKELQDIGSQLEIISLSSIRTRKEKLLVEENARLSKQCDAQPWLQLLNRTKL